MTVAVSPTSYNGCAGRRANDPGTGQPLARGVVMSDRTCSIVGCEGARYCRGWCDMHYQRWRRHGDPHVNLRRLPEAVRFWAKVKKDAAGGCWEWTAFRDRGGYGRFALDGFPRLAHRWAYRALVGEIPDGLVLDHLCRNPACVNPDHLEPVTDRVNILRGVGHAVLNAAKTHCPQGHPYAGTNLGHKNDGSRVCRTCKRRIDKRAYYRRNQALTDPAGPNRPRSLP